MTLNEVRKKISAEAINEKDSEQEISGVFCGDLLSYVMSNASAGSLWLTVMNSINVAAVAEYVGVSAVVICGGVAPVKELIAKVKERGITLFCTEKSVYEAVAALVA